ncbi:hypothetical protein LJK88_04075 [Paenibacillus sp. P26]|nr:hypothetical protein LJK88_04075 [Paenibacillus sp. P26]UUZ90738.1 hypothetical protein LJK87_33410 [Paenibacillus sp. P25]
MLWEGLLCVAAALALMILHDWRAMPSYTKREKTAYGVLTGLGAILAILLVLDPQMPGPTQWMDEPLVNLLEKLTLLRSG